MVCFKLLFHNFMELIRIFRLQSNIGTRVLLKECARKVCSVLEHALGILVLSLYCAFRGIKSALIFLLYC